MSSSKTDWLHWWHWCSLGCHIINHTSHVKMPPKNIPSKELKVFKELANHNASSVRPPDKSRVTVVMNRTSYDEKMQKMLSGAHISNSEEWPRTITWSLRGRWMPSSWVWIGLVVSWMNCTCNWEAQKAGSLHGLPKVYKLDVSLCLIVSLWPSSCTSCPSSSLPYTGPIGTL